MYQVRHVACVVANGLKLGVFGSFFMRLQISTRLNITILTLVIMIYFL
jgi:hypothetical protein